MSGTENLVMLMARKVNDPKGEPVKNCFAKRHVAKLPFKYLCLYPQSSAFLSLNERSSYLLPTVIVGADTPNWSKCGG